MALVFGIDLGGTNCRAALADGDGTLLAQLHEPTARPSGAGEEPGSHLIDQFARLLEQTRAQAGRQDELSAIGVAVPGFVDPERGSISVVPNLFGEARNVPFRSMLQARFGVPAWLENDVKAGALGELAQGWGRQYRSYVFVAVGTGTAAAVVIEGRLHRGRHGQAGEIAFTVTSPQQVGVDYGEHGCLESHVSGYGIARLYHLRQGGSGEPAAADAAPVFAAREAGDALAAAVIEEALDHLAVGLSGAIALLDPDAVILGGGIGSRLDVQEGLQRRLQASLPLFSPRLVASQLGRDAQIVGVIEEARKLIETAASHPR